VLIIVGRPGSWAEVMSLTDQVEHCSAHCAVAVDRLQQLHDKLTNSLTTHQLHLIRCPTRPDPTTSMSGSGLCIMWRPHPMTTLIMKSHAVRLIFPLSTSCPRRTSSNIKRWPMSVLPSVCPSVCLSHIHICTGWPLLRHTTFWCQMTQKKFQKSAFSTAALVYMILRP